MSEEISVDTGKEWAHLGHLLLLSHWSGNARSRWLFPVEWVIQGVLTLSSLQIPNKSAFFVQSFSFLVVPFSTSRVYRFALQGVWKVNPCHFFLQKTLVFIIEENFCRGYRFMATVCYFTTLKMSLHRILMSIACDERSAVIKNISFLNITCIFFSNCFHNFFSTFDF